MVELSITSSGDSAIFIELGNDIKPETIACAGRLVKKINSSQVPGIIEIVPSYTGMMIYFNPLVICLKDLKTRVENINLGISSEEKSDFKQIIEIPVCYDPEYGLDLDHVARSNNLSREDVIRLHIERTYLVYMLGFLPGFPYMGGINSEIATGRRSKPRLNICAGSVAITGEQTGIYPVDSPGGWQIIGRTPVKLFDPSRKPEFLLRAGIFIKFTSIQKDEYMHISGLIEDKKYKPVIKTS